MAVLRKIIKKILVPIFVRGDRVLVSLKLVKPRIIIYMDGGLCSQMNMWIQGQYYAEQGYPVYYDLDWFRRDGKGIVYRIFIVTQFDCMMLGAAGAIMYYRGTEWFIQLCYNRWLAIIAWVLFFSSGVWAKYVPSPITNEIIAITSLLVVMAGLVRKPLLENRVMNYLGKISYGIYVIHPILLYVGTRLLNNVIAGCEALQNQRGFVIFTGVSGLTIALAALSYKYYEMLFLRMKD